VPIEAVHEEAGEPEVVEVAVREMDLCPPENQ